jgi:tetratricopeptide (TPR) repeat protein
MRLIPSRLSWARWLTRTLPLAFLCVVLFAVGFGVRGFAQATKDHPNDPVEDLKARIDALKWTLTIILGAAGVFTIVQGASAFFSAQTFVKQADDTLKRVQDLATDAATRYPIFSRAEEARRDAYRDLASIFDDRGIDWRDNLYDQRMTLIQRQRLISVEHFIGLEFLRWEQDDQQYAVNLRRLANFYAYKYLSEKYHSDLERAEYYLELARGVTKDAFYILNDLGMIYVTFRQPRDYGKAKEFFLQSHNKQADQQRALYNLAWIAAESEGKFAEAVKLLEVAVHATVWERQENPEMTGNLYYNLGCYRAMLAKAAAGQPPEVGYVAASIQALAKAAEIGKVKPALLTDDMTKVTGQLYFLANHRDAKVRQSLKALESKLTSPAPPAVRKPLRQRLETAWRDLWPRS